MTTPPEQLQAKPVLRIKAAETRVSAFLPHKNPVNSSLWFPLYTHEKTDFFFLFSLNNTIILDQIFVTPVKTSTAVALILILAEEKLQPGETIKHTFGETMDGFWK